LTRVKVKDIVEHFYLSLMMPLKYQADLRRVLKGWRKAGLK